MFDGFYAPIKMVIWRMVYAGFNHLREFAEFIFHLLATKTSRFGLARRRHPHGLPEQGRLRARGLRGLHPALGVLVAVGQVVPLAVVQPEVFWMKNDGT